MTSADRFIGNFPFDFKNCKDYTRRFHLALAGGTNWAEVVAEKRAARITKMYGRMS
jgi:hypothetical protein